MLYMFYFNWFSNWNRAPEWNRGREKPTSIICGAFKVNCKCGSEKADSKLLCKMYGKGDRKRKDHVMLKETVGQNCWCVTAS